MAFDHIIFAGVDLSSGRRPVTFTALDPELKIIALVNWSVSEAISCLNEYPEAVVAINSSERKATTAISTDFRNKLGRAGYKSMSKGGQYRWIETDSQKCFQLLCEKNLLPRRTLEGRIQRALILYEAGVQLTDPMDFFEEITRHKLMQGILPIENLNSSKELDALVAAYLAWMAVQRTHLVELNGNAILPIRE